MRDILNVPAEMATELDRIANTTDADSLVSELNECLSITVSHVIRLAAIVRRLDDLGITIDVKFAWASYIRRVAYGQIVPELFVSLQADSTLLAKASSLPIPDQTRVANNEPLKVMEPGGDHRLVPPMSMTRREIRQVFGRGCLRSDAEQIGWLRDQDLARQSQRTTEAAEVTIDRRRGGIVVGDTFVSARELALYMAELAGKR